MLALFSSNIKASHRGQNDANGSQNCTNDAGVSQVYTCTRIIRAETRQDCTHYRIHCCGKDDCCFAREEEAPPREAAVPLELVAITGIIFVEPMPKVALTRRSRVRLTIPDDEGQCDIAETCSREELDGVSFYKWS